MLNIEYVRKCHQYLIENREMLIEFQAKRGLEDAIIVAMDIGYDRKTARYTIPIYDYEGELINIRKYKLNPGDEPKILSEKGAVGKALYPLHHYSVASKNTEYVFICEGELDALTLIQHGSLALTSTAGAYSWDDEWDKYFSGKHVYLCFDTDKAGKEAAVKIAGRIKNCIDVSIIDLDVDKDITDYFVKHKKTNDDFFELIDNAPVFDNCIDTNVVDGVSGEHCGKKLKFRAIVVGKDLSPYQIPYKVKVTCEDELHKMTACSICPFQEKQIKEINHTYNFERDKEVMLRMVNRSDTQVIGAIRSSLGIPPSSMCRRCKIEIVERNCVEDLSLIPEIDYSSPVSRYAIRRGYFFGRDIDTNSTYEFKGTTLPDPDNQMALYLMNKAVSTKDSISRFELTDKMREDLKIFQPEENTMPAIAKKITEICDDLSYNVTKIYQRDHLIVAGSLVYHSVLHFDFDGTRERKGWLEASILGDTRSGKTDTIYALCNHYRAGEFVTSGENATISGLIGGLQQTHSAQWTVTWAKIPLNDRALCVIDEADELARKFILPKLSAIRSTGVAELVKVQTQRTMARTRLIFIMNPMEGHALCDYDYGILAIKELFKDMQDIRRIDILIGCAGDEVPIEVINSKRQEKGPDHKYTSDLCHANVMRCWNIKPENVIFEEGAQELILQEAIGFETDYSAEIPIVIGAKIKLARMAVALAGWLYSTRTGDEVIVTKAHVKWISFFLRAQYDNPVLAFRDFTKQVKRHYKLGDTNGSFAKITRLEIVDELMNSSTINGFDIEEIFACDRDGARKILQEFRLNGALKKIGQYYKKTPAFINYLRSLRRDFIGKIYRQGGFNEKQDSTDNQAGSEGKNALSMAEK